MADRKNKTGFDRQKVNNKKSKHPTPVPALEGRYEWSSGCVSRRYQNGELKEMREVGDGGYKGRTLGSGLPLIADVSKIHQRI